VLDFNPHHVRWQHAHAGDGGGVTSPSAGDEGAGVRGKGGSVQVVRGRTLLEHGGEANPWRRKLYSELPYVLSVSETKFGYCAVVMDEDRLIGLKARHVILLPFSLPDLRV
jgi:hypothetical protein